MCPGSAAPTEPIDATVRVGESVTRGQALGLMASAPSHCPSGCLHLGAKRGDTYLDPLLLLTVPRIVLMTPQCPTEAPRSWACRSRPRVRLRVTGLEPLDRHVGVEPGRGERTVAQVLGPCAGRHPLDEMGRRAVPQSVRPHVGSAGNLTEQAMHDRAYLTRIQSPSPTAQEERRAAQRTDEPGPRAGEPALDGLGRGRTGMARSAPCHPCR